MSRTLEEVWADIPDAHCKGHCVDSCGPIPMSDVERTRIADRHGITIPDPLAGDIAMTCPALTYAGRCAVRDDRPLICRMYGSAAGLPCPHGCAPTFGLLDDATAAQLLAESLEAER